MSQSPYDLCSVCSNFATEDHHAPEKSLLHTWDRDKPEYRKPMCRRHHEERTRLGYKRFKEIYPDYKEVTIEEYRAQDLKN